MTAFAKQTAVEAKLFRRDPMSLFWALIFPALLLLVLGLAYPGFTDPSEDLNGHRAVDLYAPIVLGLGVATVGVAGVPVYLATYREKGVLRRLSTTPVPPRSLLAALLTVQLAAAVVAATLASAVAVLAFDVPAPRHPLRFGLAFAARRRVPGRDRPRHRLGGQGASAAQGIGMVLYFPMLFFAGVYFPREVMPEGLRTISDLTPAGAAVAALEDSWIGTGPSGF